LLAETNGDSSFARQPGKHFVEFIRVASWRYVNAWPVDWRGEMHLLPGETLEAERDRRLAVFESGLAFQPNGERARDMLRGAEGRPPVLTQLGRRLLGAEPWP
jgi:hypothetical protein